MTTIRTMMKKDYANAMFAFVAASLSNGNVFFAIIAMYFSIVSMLQSTDRWNIHFYIGINMLNMYCLFKGLFGVILALLAIAA